MEIFSDIFFNLFIFLAIYVQVFLLMTFLEKRRNSSCTTHEIISISYPSVTVIVPCFNEESTVTQTVDSLLSLDYPKDKLFISIVDDGSTDNTWGVIQRFVGHSNISIFKKDNGGKHTALNLAISNLKTDLVGSLDADSFADKCALKNIARHFQDPLTMAVVPSILIHEPKNIVELAQNAEYQLSVFVKKMLALLGAMHVTPGPLSIFRKEVFEKIGPYRKAYNTEDAEMALRMQKNRLKIDYCLDAVIYTKAPNTVKKLYKQRLRWTYGFLKNSIDYRGIFFRSKYGNVSFFTLPAGIVSLLAVIFIVFTLIKEIFNMAIDKIAEFRAVGLNFNFFSFKFDWFYVDTKSVTFMMILLYILVVVSILIGKRLSKIKPRLSLDMLYFVILSGFLAPFWILKSFYNLVFFKDTTWR